MSYLVVFSPTAQSQLNRIEDYITDAASPGIATIYIDSIIETCRSLSTFPNRGTRRDDLAPAMRSIGFRKRVTIAFQVVDDHVDILGIFYGGQDLEAAFQTDDQ